MKYVYTCMLSILISLEAIAGSVPESCNIALGQIKDNYFMLSEKEQFEDYQSRLCEEKFESFNDFSKKGSELGLDIPLAKGMLGLNGASDSQQSSFKEKYEKFCSLDSSTKTAKSKYTSNITKVSNALANNWLKCHQVHLTAYVEKYKLGTFIEATPQDGYREFTVKVTRKSIRTGKVVVNSLNPGRSVSCFWGRNKIVEGKTQIAQNEFTLSCEKHPSKAVQFSLDTQDGASNVVKIPAQESKISELSDKLDTIYQQVIELERYKVPSGTIAYFETQGCPTAWSRASQVSGRYIVGAYEANQNEVGRTVGERLSPNENRPTGNHKHNIEGLRYIKANENYYARGNGMDTRAHTPSTENPAPEPGMTFKNGTNAPYIIMSVCRKN